MIEKQIKHKGVILSDKEVNQLLNEQDERIQELENELNGIYKSYSDYYGMSIRNAEWYGFKGDVE